MFIFLKKFVFSTVSDNERKTSVSCQKIFVRGCTNWILRLPGIILKKMKALWKKDNIFSSSIFVQCLKNFGHLYVSSVKFWGKPFNFSEKKLYFSISGHFRYKVGTFSSSLSSVHCTCQWEPFERYFFFERKHPLLSLSDFVRKNSGVASDFRNCFLRVYENKMEKNGF